MQLSNGIGTWWPGTEDFLARVRGRVERIVFRSVRWEGGIDYSVRVADPDAYHVHEEDAERQIWIHTVEFGRVEESPSPRAVWAAREQERIAKEIWEQYGVNAVDKSVTE